MKKLTLFLVAMLFSALSFAALNPYAYGLSSELSADKTTLTVNYSLNADATSVEFVLISGGSEIQTVDLAYKGLTKGSYTAEIPTADFPKGRNLTWNIKVGGNSVTIPTEHPTKYSFYHPSAVDIDNNPENATFGLILCNEGMQSVVSQTSGYVSAKFGAGIFAFNPAFEPMPNPNGKPGYNGGITFTTTRADGTGTAYAPRRIRISEDGRIFVTSLNTDGNYLWEVNPENMNEWTPVFKGTLNTNKELVDAGGSNFVAAPNNGFDVKGSGENLRLMMYSVNLPGITAADMNGYRCDEYNLGTATEWTTAPSKNWVNGKYAINYTGTQVEYDNEGGIWIASYRGTASNANPGLVHINADGVEDAKLIWNNVRQAGIRFNKDFTKLVVAGNNGAAKKATVYTISKDANGAPVLTQEVVVNMTTVGNNLNDFAWDYAGNLYACGNSSEKLVAWAMPYSGTVSTPCASQYAFELPAPPVTITGTVKRAIQCGEHVIVLTHEADGTPHIYRVTNGVAYAISQEGVVACDPENLGDYLSISDIAVTEDGKLVACNYMLCQYNDTYVDAGYKRGTSRYYIWDDLAGDPKSWFTSQANGNYFRANVGQTMAVKGTSTNAKVLVSCFTNAVAGGARHIIHTVQGGSVTSIRNNGITNMENPKVGASTYEFIASPSAEHNWIVDGDKVAPMEIVTTKTDNTDLSFGTKMDASILGTKYNGASILTIRGMHLMVAPYADGSGKVAGVKVLDITKGLDAVELKATVDLTTPVAATAAATAVKSDDNTLTITLVTDAALHTLTATIEIPEEIVGVVKRAVQIGETTVVLTHEADGTPHIYRVTDGMAYAVSQEGVVARDPDNKGDYLAISDIAVTDDGKLVANNYVRCQFGSSTTPESGYKKGTSYYYIWNNLTSDPSIWFTSQHTARSSHADVGKTFAVKGTSTNAKVLVTAVHNNNRAVRMSLHSIISGVYEEPNIDGGVYSNDYYMNFGLHTSAAYYKESAQGKEFQLNSSATDGKWYLEGELSEPTEFVVPALGAEYSASSILATGTLGNKYNGATYLTIDGKQIMVAPYADASGKVAGVRIMDVTNGLATAKWLKNGVLATPVAATAAATAVKADGNTLTVTLVTDATLHTFTITLDEAPSATALNPYAYNLKATWDLASKTLTTNYTLNADAKEVYITFGDGNVEYARRQTTGITRGTHTYALTLTDEEFSKLPQNRGLTWNVIVKANKRTQYAECVTNYSLYHPSSIDIDNNPKNKTFGTIIVAESMHKAKNIEGYLSSGYGAGIYVFNPDFTPVSNGMNPGYNGGNAFTEKRADNSSKDAYAPRRVRISDDGRIFVTSLNTNGDVLWEVNPDNMNTWTKVFTGLTQDAKKDLYNGSTFVAGPNAGFDVRGSGADLKLLMLSANTDTYLNGQTGFRVSEYNLGTKTSWNTAPSKAFPHENFTQAGAKRCYFMSAPASQVQYDQNGGVWYIQYRGGTTNTCPGLVHFTAGGVEDYKELRNNTNNAGFRFNNDFTKVVIAGDPTVSGQVKAIIYAVSKDAAGKPVLTEESFVDMGTVGTAMNDFAWDYANNLYVVGNNREKVVAYAMPYSGEVTTPCAEKVIILAGWVPPTTPALNPFAYGLSSELIDGGMNLKINYSLNAPANSAQVVIMNGNTDVKTIPCTDLTKGAHSITIPTDDLPMNTDLTWKVVVNGTSEDKVMEYATKHQFYHPSSIDVDNNPENETFGLVLVNEAMQSVKNTTSTKPYISKGFGAGIFAFDPAFENPGKYNGGITFTNTRADNAEATAYAPRRIRISDDGRIFVTSLNTNGDVLWEVNAEDMNNWTPIFTGLTQDANKDLVNGGTFVAGPNAGFDVRGSGDKLQLLMLSSNTQAFGLGQRGFRVSEYNLGTNTSWNTAPSKAFPHENLSTGQCYFINPTASQVQYDKDGGVWYIQYRAEATELLPTLVHFNKNGVEDFKWLRDGTRNAAFRFNNDFTKVAISDQQFVNFYTVSKDASGKPVLTWESGFSLATLGNAINDFAWDYANNFYAVSNSNEWAVAYRLPYSGEVTTPAASKHVIRVVYDVVVSEDDKTLTTTLEDYDNIAASVELKRELHLNEWNTLTLPFGMDATQIEEAFGTGTKVAMLTTSRIKAANSVYIGFSLVNQIEAGKPYLINPTKQVTEDIVPVIINTSTQTISTTILDMIPVLDEEAWEADENNFFLGPDAYLYQDAAGGVMPPLRAYFQFKGLTSQQLSSIRARVAFGEDEATDLEDLEVTTQEEVIKVIENGQLYIIRGGVKYNIQGQIVNK